MGVIANPQAYVRDREIVSASVPQRFRTRIGANGELIIIEFVGTGTITSPSVAGMTVSEDAITAGYRAQFSEKDQWIFQAFRIGPGAMPRQVAEVPFANEFVTLNKDGKTWTLRAVRNKSLVLTATITKGNTDFALRDEFNWSTFRSEHKANEIEEGHIDLELEQPQYLAQFQK
jgi:hypothetical protein